MSRVAETEGETKGHLVSAGRSKGVGEGGQHLRCHTALLAASVLNCNFII